MSTPDEPVTPAQRAVLFTRLAQLEQRLETLEQILIAQRAPIWGVTPMQETDRAAQAALEAFAPLSPLEVLP